MSSAAGAANRLRRRAVRLAAIPRRAVRAFNAGALAHARRRPVIAGSVFYESFAGNGALCNPEAIFRALIAAPDQQHRTHVWALAGGGDAHRGIRAEFADDPRVTFVDYRSPAYYAALSRAEVLVNNATFPPQFAKRPGQTYLNTWHGTPLKRMGYDMPDGAWEAANTMRNFVAADWLLSQNAFMTETMYRRAYKLDGFAPGTVIESGYPRVDRQTASAADLDGCRARLADDGVRFEAADGTDRKVVVYAPTWRGANFAEARADASALVGTVARLQERLGDGYVVVLKAHQQVHAALASDPAASGVLVDNDVPTNLVLGIADVLVSDYSSIFFDFLPTGRRILFFTPDADRYALDRGTYLDGEPLPGVVATSVGDLADAIVAPEPAEVAAVAADWQLRFTPYDDGAATERVIDVVFRGVRDPDRAVLVPLAEPSAAAAAPTGGRKRSILLYLGGMRSNGITSSALNLLSHLDHDAFDVSVLIARSQDPDARANGVRIDPRVRQFHRFGGLNGPKRQTFGMRARVRVDPERTVEPEYERQLWRDEWRRVIGDVTFDAAVDFSGYSRLWTQLLLHSPAELPQPRRSIWLHNDMAAEVHREVNGKQRMRRSLPAVFSRYPRFDALVSVSEALAEHNADHLADRLGIERSRFVAAHNVIEETRILAGLDVPLDDEAPDLAERMREAGTRWFVTVGRLSEEKNQARLIRAFAKVEAQHPEARLAIVGEGAKRTELEALVAELDLGHAVVLAGALTNPFAAMRAADCFVLSSNYEGQPMVLLEAAIVGLPVVTVRFASVESALPPESMLVVEQTDAALADGMLALWSDGIPIAALDAASYNASALAEFTAAVLAD